MNKKILLLLAAVCLLSASACKREETEKLPSYPSYDMEATADDEGVQIDENGDLIVPSTSEDYGKSNGTIVVTTPEKNGNYDVLTYNFPYSKLESISYESHFADKEQAKSFYETRKSVEGISNLELDGKVVRFTDISSEWIGFKKRDILGNLSKTWDKLGYTYTNN